MKSVVAEWIEPRLLLPTSLSALRRQFLKAKPFPHFLIENFLQEQRAREVVKALSKERFEKKQSDLFSLSQTLDFVTMKQGSLSELYSFFCGEAFRDLMQSLTGVNLCGNIDMAGSLYEDCDFLLCHDDRLEGRKLAYIYYLCDGFVENDGGALALLGDLHGKPGVVVQRYNPRWNNFIVFAVSKKSRHEVEEVLSQKQRYAIGGWLH